MFNFYYFALKSCACYVSQTNALVVLGPASRHGTLVVLEFVQLNSTFVSTIRRAERVEFVQLGARALPCGLWTQMYTRILDS